ncbi:unnamed protein product [Coffea canephora]|uniref:DH200=94 genomic scaffold, scaffold_4137 n=1 Tax=Coffea canephora TaxID=49390 RepID=A0A068VP07_COFCA|nr:unnamed protein product [Coffea canephora]
MKHAENRVACAKLVESSMDGEELEGSWYMKKSACADTLIPEKAVVSKQKCMNGDVVDNCSLKE